MTWRSTTARAKGVAARLHMVGVADNRGEGDAQRLHLRFAPVRLTAMTKDQTIITSVIDFLHFIEMGIDNNDSHHLTSHVMCAVTLKYFEKEIHSYSG